MNVLWASNHNMTDVQERELGYMLPDTTISTLSAESKKVWGDVDPSWQMDQVEKEVEAIVNREITDDTIAVCVMGELSMCMALIEMCRRKGIMVFTPTTRRESKEVVKDDGTVVKTNVFSHCTFRRLA